MSCKWRPYSIKRIISELTDFSRPTGARIDHEIDVNQVVEKSLDLTATILKKATACLSVTYGKNLPMIRGNFGKLQQVMINLLVNAGQALEPEQSIHVQTTFNDQKAFGQLPNTKNPARIPANERSEFL